MSVSEIAGLPRLFNANELLHRKNQRKKFLTFGTMHCIRWINSLMASQRNQWDRDRLEASMRGMGKLAMNTPTLIGSEVVAYIVAAQHV